jgi:hypothetical protein
MAELNAAAISMNLQAVIVQAMGVAACQAGADHTYSAPDDGVRGAHLSRCIARILRGSLVLSLTR